MRLRTPKEITEATLDAGGAKVSLTPATTIIQAIQAGAFIAFGGALSLIIGFGFPELTAGNPSLQRLLSGCMFPIGLILVVILGAELFTGNNALLMPGLMKRRFTAGDVLRNWVLVYAGNFVGAIAFCYLLVYSVGLTAAEPYHSSIIGMAQAKVSMPWMTVMLKGIGANWCVCLAVWLAIGAKTFPGKVIACLLPVATFVALGYEHCVANMFFIPAGMMTGADVTMGELGVNLLMSTLGNIAGGALFVGCLAYWLYRKSLG